MLKKMLNSSRFLQDKPLLRQSCSLRGAAVAIVLVVAGTLSGGVASTFAQDNDVAQQARYAEIIDSKAINAANSLSTAFRNVASLAEPCVVRVIGYNARGQVTGTGFVIDADGILVTNNHVVEPADRLFVEFTDHTRYPATVIGTDPLTDLAVLSINAKNLKALKFFESETAIEVGEWVVAVGCPLGLEQSVTAGIISAKGRHLDIIIADGRPGYEDFIQTDAAINKGNSGGPLINLEGEVIGVNSAIITETGGSDGLGFAIPTSIVKRVVRELREDGHFDRGLLGVGIQDLSPNLALSYGYEPSMRGVLVTNVSANMPAAKVGLRSEDIITAINGKQIQNTEHLRSAVALHQPQEQVRVDILRANREISYNVVLASMTGLDNNNANGVRVNQRSSRDIGMGVDIQNARTGRSKELLAYVDKLIPGGPADLAGLQRNDIIIDINGQTVESLAAKAQTSPADYVDSIFEKTNVGTILRLKIERPGPGRSYMVKYIGVEIP